MVNSKTVRDLVEEHGHSHMSFWMSDMVFRHMRTSEKMECVCSRTVVFEMLAQLIRIDQHSTSSISHPFLVQENNLIFLIYADIVK